MRNVTRRDLVLGSSSLAAAGTLGACSHLRRQATDDGGVVEKVDVATLDEAGRERARAEVRHALTLLFDREYICNNIVRSGDVPANTYVAWGNSEPDGTDFTYRAGAGEGRGYFDPYDEAIEANYREAMSIFRKYYDYDETTRKLTNFRPMTLLYDNGGRKADIGVYLQADFEEVGIPLQLENQEMNTFLSNIASGDFQIAWGAWSMDYLDPIDMLSLCLSDSHNNFNHLGQGEHAHIGAYDLDLTDEGIDLVVEGGTWADTYDALIGAINGVTDDEEKRFRLMHRAEDLLMEMAVNCPLCWGVRPYLLKGGIEGVWISPMGIVSFDGATSADGSSSINVSYGGEPETLDPGAAYTSVSASMVQHLFSGLAKCVPDDEGDGIRVEADCATELVEPVENEDGTYTYTYTLRDDLTWSDGLGVTAHDFEFAWKRAAAPEFGSNNRELFEPIKGYKDNDLAVTVIDDRTLEVVLTKNVAYWDQLLGFSVYFPVREDVVANDNWAYEASTLVSNGPYVLDSWAHDAVLTMERRADYHDADEVTMGKLNWYLSDNDVTNLNNYESGNWQFIPNVPSQEVDRVKREYADEYHVVPSATSFYLSFNANFDMLPS